MRITGSIGTESADPKPKHELKMDMSIDDPNVRGMLHKVQEIEVELKYKEVELQKLRDDVDLRFGGLQQEYETRLQGLEIQIGNISQIENNKTLVKKPEVVDGKRDQSLEPFVGHMELYVSNAAEHDKFGIAASFLGGSAYEWYQLVSKDGSIINWSQLKEKLYQRYQPINKVFERYSVSFFM